MKMNYRNFRSACLWLWLHLLLSYFPTLTLQQEQQKEQQQQQQQQQREQQQQQELEQLNPEEHLIVHENNNNENNNNDKSEKLLLQQQRRMRRKMRRQRLKQMQQQQKQKIIPSFFVTPEGTYQYSICNGLSNQLLFHAAHIAKAKQLGYKRIDIPDYFVLDGTQLSDENVLPSTKTAVPLGHVFDLEYFFQVLQNNLDVQPSLIRYDRLGDGNDPEPPPCNGFSNAFALTDSKIVRVVLEAFRPSPLHVEPIVQSILKALPKDTGNGVCLHHRNGQDWVDHCHRWSTIPDGLYRGNCLQLTSSSYPSRSFELTFLDLLQSRAFNRPGRWMYYCGDYDTIPAELINATKNGGPLRYIASKQQILRTESVGFKLRELISQQQEIVAEQFGLGNLDLLLDARDFWALIDFFVCRRMRRFVGNSVSTFSAIQIALRRGQGAYWYNSQSVPLAGIWNAFLVPIVYTYTELSSLNGQHLLRTSIHSVRTHLPPENPIHILYHGTEDIAFRSWLQSQNVIIHQHHPAWKDDIEEMRRNGDPLVSHLFSNPGNYFGTWQRIDIPLFVESEYALLLDSDTVVKAPFTIDDLGLNLTLGIAMSSELTFHSKEPSNAGVMVMNIPFLRKTHAEFVRFILQHKNTAKFDHPSPSDQGAYLDFYRNDVQFLDYHFNLKPYFPIASIHWDRTRIVHFHGPKPHDYIEFMLGGECNPAYNFLCKKSFGISPGSLCKTLTLFAKSMTDPKGYCQSSFLQDAGKASSCLVILQSLASEDHCDDFARFMMKTAMEAVKRENKSDWLMIGNNVNRIAGMYLFSIFGVIALCLVLVSPKSIFKRSRAQGFLLVCVGIGVINMVQSQYVILIVQK